MSQTAKLERDIPDVALGNLTSNPLSKERRLGFERAEGTRCGDRPALSTDDWSVLQRICTDDPTIERGELAF